MSEGNYPNPFNAGTVIPLTLTQVAEVEVTVYNALGQKIRTLWSGEMSAGQHEVPWDGKNSRGRAVPSGMYFYQITSPQTQITKKMVVVK